MSAPSATATTSRTAQAQSEYRQFVFPCVKPLYEDPLVLVEGRGSIVVDSEGSEYLDFFGGILTTSLGHCHPEVVARVVEQAARLGHTSTLYINQNHVTAARRLSEIAPGRLSQSFFTNSGTEAVETAVTLACIYTGNTEVISVRHGYSGRSILTTNLTGHGSWRPLGSSIPGVKHVMSPNRYRSPLGDLADPAFVDALAEDLEDVIQTTTKGRLAAFIAETIQGVGGYIVPPPGYFQRMVEIVRSYGGLFICDEVQAGFGRTGRKWFGIEHWGVEPDIMVMAKGIANGFPVGATITRPEIAEVWTGKTISTFGGNAVCMAATDAAIEVMVREDTPGRSEVRGQQLKSGLERLSQQHQWIGDVRGMGLMQALELVEDRRTKEPSSKKARALLEAAKDEQLLIGIGGLHNNTIRIGPSMLVTEDEVQDALDRLGRACRRVDSLR